MSYFLCFLFQAEDGIRGWSVTGVQTCALPISRRTPRRSAPTTLRTAVDRERMAVRRVVGAERLGVLLGAHAQERRDVGRRSEERRVGKECRCRCRSGARTET